jgi:hypothetical protein
MDALPSSMEKDKEFVETLLTALDDPRVTRKISEIARESIDENQIIERAKKAVSDDVSRKMLSSFRG